MRGSPSLFPTCEKMAPAVVAGSTTRLSLVWWKERMVAGP